MDVRPSGEGALVTVRVRPRARAGVEVRQGVPTVSVAAPPIDGRATEEARHLLAEALGVPPGRVSLRTGARARMKVFEVAGLAPEEVERRLSGGGS